MRYSKLQMMVSLATNAILSCQPLNPNYSDGVESVEELGKRDLITCSVLFRFRYHLYVPQRYETLYLFVI